MRIDFNIDNAGLAWSPGKMKISGTNPQASNVDVYVRIQQLTPLADVVPETLLATNVTATVGTFTDSTISIPTNGDGSILTDPQTYSIILKSTGTSTVLQTIAVTSGGPTPAGPNKVSALSVTRSLNLLEGSFTVTDETALPDLAGFTATRAWTITGPTVLHVPTATVTSTAVFLKTFFDYVNVTYNVLFKLDMVYQFFDGDIDLYEYYSLDTQFDYLVRNVSICDTKTCILNELSAFQAIACNAGGFDKMPPKERARMLDLFLLLLKWEVASDCQDDAQKQLIYDELVSKFACCASATSDEITAFLLPNGTAPVQTPWALVGTAFINSFVNSTPGLRWKVTTDGELRIVGKIQVPGSLVSGTSYIITSAFVTVPTATLLALAFPAFSVSSGFVGTLRFTTAGELTYVPNGTSVLEFVYIDMQIPLS